MSRELIFDIETIGDIRDYSQLKITVVSIFDYATDSYVSFDETNLSGLWPYIEKADRLIGYNSDHFDIPILNRYYPGELTAFPSLDMLKVVKDVLGKRYKLNDLAKATLQIEKSADGLQAQEWYKQGKIDEIKKYCEQDVKVTKELYEYGRQNKMLYYPTITGEIMPFAVNFDPPPVAVSASGAAVGKGINLTLPF